MKKASIWMFCFALIMQPVGAITNDEDVPEVPPLDSVTITGTAGVSPVGAGGGGGGGSNGRQMDQVGADAIELAANRKQPGCKREQTIQDTVISSAREGNPLSTEFPQTVAQAIQLATTRISDIFTEDFTRALSGGVRDPAYQDPSWIKLRYVIEGYEYPSSAAAAAQAGGAYFLIEVHYWWNNQTHAVEQFKFKTTKEQGCAGSPST